MEIKYAVMLYCLGVMTIISFFGTYELRVELNEVKKRLEIVTNQQEADFRYAQERFMFLNCNK